MQASFSTGVRLGGTSAWELSSVCDTDTENQVWMPVIGLGMSYQQESSQKKKTLPTPSAVTALRHGYRLFDTASRYETERALGLALEQNVAPRESIFITSKLWASHYGQAKERYIEQCQRIGVSSLDCYLIHWPQPWNEYTGNNREARAETWRQMENLLEMGKCRSIGVSNFSPSHLLQLTEDCSITPHLNQVEYNPFQQNIDIVPFCHDNGIVVQGYCPLAKGHALQHPVVIQIAKGYKVSPAQVLLRYSLQSKVALIPKASSEDHIINNTKIFDFHLRDETMGTLNDLHCNLRSTWDPTGIP